MAENDVAITFSRGEVGNPLPVVQLPTCPSVGDFIELTGDSTRYVVTSVTWQLPGARARVAIEPG